MILLYVILKTKEFYLSSTCKTFQKSTEQLISNNELIF